MLATTEEYTVKIITCRLKGHIIAKEWLFKWFKPHTSENPGDEAVQASYLYCVTCHIAKLSTGDTGPG